MRERGALIALLIVGIMFSVIACNPSSGIARPSEKDSETISTVLVAANKALQGTSDKVIQSGNTYTLSGYTPDPNDETQVMLTGEITVDDKGNIISVDFSVVQIGDEKSSFAMETNADGSISISIDGEDIGTYSSSVIPRRSTKTEQDIISLIGWSISESGSKVKKMLRTAIEKAWYEDVLSLRNYDAGNGVTISGTISSSGVADLSSYTITDEEGTLSGHIRNLSINDDKDGKTSGIIRYDNYTPTPNGSMANEEPATIVSGTNTIDNESNTESMRFDGTARIGNDSYHLIYATNGFTGEIILNGQSLLPMGFESSPSGEVVPGIV